MARQDAVLPHLACIGEPAASLGARNGRSVSSIFRWQAERRKGAVVGDLFQEVGEAADLVDRDEKARLLGAPGRGLAPLLLRLRFRRHLGDRLRLEAPEVGVIAAEIPAAAVALAAGTLRRIGVLAKEELRQA